MKYKDIKSLQKAEILKKIKECSMELFQLKMKKKFESVNNPLKIRILRRDIARLKTSLAQRGLDRG